MRMSFWARAFGWVGSKIVLLKFVLLKFGHTKMGCSKKAWLQKIIIYFSSCLHNLFFFNCWQNHVQWIIAKMVFRFTLQQKHNTITMYHSMGIMNCSQIMLMADHTSKWILLPYGIMALICGGLEKIFG